MKKSTKAILGIATIWPILYTIIFSIFIFYPFSFLIRGMDPPSDLPPFFIIIFPLHALTMLWIVGLLVVYITDVFKNERVEKDKKALWAIVLFAGGIIAMPIYWYLYIWRSPKKTA